MTEETPIRRRLAAILAADIAGYSRLMGEDDVATVRDLKGHQSAVMPLVAQHGGRIIDTAGDGLLAEFPSVTDATACALGIQAVMAARNQPVPEHRRMRFRMGINLGDVIFDDSRIYGDGINVAARLEALAQPGGILVSQAVYEQVRHRLKVGFDDLGEQELKNIAHRVHVYRVRAETAAGVPAPAAESRPVANPPAAEASTSGTAGASSRAVFLSYASQDADTARQIAETLRAVGIEVWFDQSELEGGDAWDRKIRQQIQSCALFVPIISPNTERRPEGYFRLEWWLAEQRSFRMARGLPFLFPVTLDVAATEQAKVPEAFNAVQWTRLDGGRIPADFAARVKALLTGGSVTHTPQGAPAAARSRPVPSPAPTPDDRSIAVLAFVNLSSDKDNEYFSDGIAEELLNLLAQIPQLKVIARTSSFSFKGKDVPIAEIARQLDVAHVLEGSVRKAGNRVRITAQLIRGSDSAHLWSANYDRTLDDIFAVQDEIAAEVVAQLKIRLLGDAPKVAETDPEAYALYLQARQLSWQGTAAGLAEALALIEQALAIDPSYVRAWTRKAAIISSQAGNGLIPAQAGWRQAREAANRALALDPLDAVAHLRMGWITLRADQDLVTAVKHYTRALALAPSSSIILFGASGLLRALGRMEQALAILEWDAINDPLNPVSHMGLGGTYFDLGRFDEALASFRTALRLSPGYHNAPFLIAFTLLLLGRTDEALSAAQALPDADQRLFLETMCLHALGRRAESDSRLAEFIEKHSENEPVDIASLLAYRGEADRAFEWLDRAFEQDDPSLFNIATLIEFKHLHDDPRWLPFLRRIGMAPEQLDAIPFEVRLPT